MMFPARLDQALARLSGALHRLQAAVDRREQADSLRADLDQELALVQDDRTRLANELDAALAQARKLATVNGEVSARLDRASATVAGVIAGLAQQDAAAGEMP